MNALSIHRCALCRALEIKGHALDFIAWIHRDGTGVTDMAGKDMSAQADTTFALSCLSITNGTYIASHFNSYVVRIRANTNP